MRDQELVNALREHADWWENGDMMDPLGGLEKDLLAAADRIANQSTHIAALQKEIEKLRGQVPRWIPVEERLPEYGVRVLATDMYEEDDCTGIWTREEYPDDPEDGCWIDDRGWWHAFDDVTHWMPLPDRPEAEKALEAMKDE